MSKLRLLIKRPGSANTCIPVTVNGTDSIGNCISSLVGSLGFPRQDGLGRRLTYSLRPLSGGHPLPNTLRFVDVQLLPETRLVLEVDEANAVTQPVSTSVAESGSARSPVAVSAMNPLCHMMNRRTFVVGSVLAGGAVSGLLHPLNIGSAPLRLPGLSPKTASSGLHAPASTATGSGAEGSGAFRLLPSYASVSCAACPFSPGLAPAAGSQRTYPNSKSGNHQALWRSRILCHLTGVGNSLTSVLKVIRIPSSRTSVLLRREPHGLSRSLPLTFSHFLSVFALHPSVFALSC